MTERQIRHVARRAIAILNERGWKRGKARKHGRGPICLWDAIWAADKTPNAAWYGIAPTVIARIESHICATTKMRHLHRGKKLIPRWNDAKGRTVDEVIAMLESVARGERQPFTYRDETGLYIERSKV